MTWTSLTSECRRSETIARSRAMHGLIRTLIQNMVTGVTTGFTKSLEIQGVGYRAEATSRITHAERRLFQSGGGAASRKASPWKSRRIPSFTSGGSTNSRSVRWLRRFEGCANLNLTEAREFVISVNRFDARSEKLEPSSFGAGF